MRVCIGKMKIRLTVKRKYGIIQERKSERAYSLSSSVAGVATAVALALAMKSTIFPFFDRNPRNGVPTILFAAMKFWDSSQIGHQLFICTPKLKRLARRRAHSDITAQSKKSRK